MEQRAREFDDLHARFADFLARSEPRKEAWRYPCGLLAARARKNCLQMAEVMVGEDDPQLMQRLLYGARWEADEAWDQMERFVCRAVWRRRGHRRGALDGPSEEGYQVVGRETAMQRYSAKDRELPSRGLAELLQPPQLSLSGPATVPGGGLVPEWERRQDGGVPEDVTFKTKPQLALEILKRAWSQGVSVAWVT
jgi:hypothetical protein